MTLTYPYPGETTTYLQDYMGRYLVNATPGTSDATDYMGRNVTTGNKDYMGRPLTFAEPAAWTATHAYTAGTEVLIGGDLLQVTTAGTSGSTAPTPPAAVRGTVTDGTVTWTRVH